MANLYIKWDSGLRLTSDTDGADVLWAQAQNIPRSVLIGRMVQSGVYTLAPSDVGLTLAQGDITNIEVIQLRANFTGMGYKTIGASYTILNQSIPDADAVAQIMTLATSVVISAAGTTGGTLSYVLAGS